MLLVPFARVQSAPHTPSPSLLLSHTHLVVEGDLAAEEVAVVADKLRIVYVVGVLPMALNRTDKLLFAVALLFTLSSEAVETRSK